MPHADAFIRTTQQRNRRQSAALSECQQTYADLNIAANERKLRILVFK